MAQASTMSVLSRHQADVVRAVSTASYRTAQAKLAVAAEVGQLERVRDTAAREQASVQTLARQAQALLSSLQAAQRAELARRQAAERERQLTEQRVLAAANAKAAAPAAAAGGRASRSNPRSSAAVPSPGGGGGGAKGSIGQRVLAYALAQVGKSYVYAGVGPRSYDCSGLTMMAYRSVGIHLPRYGGHGGQADVGRHVPISQLMPGDLVLYYPPSLHHIAMYAGNGRIVHAANPRAGVLTDSLNSMPIAFAVRPY
jgi:cell wall-associated NlpC family hydrolase